jgi:BlaI family transcriptional regulator, penicillinase repressor
MTRSKPPLTPLELEIMNVLWETGPANVQTVQQKLARPLAYTTVQTMLNVLHRKGSVSRELEQKAYFYRPALSHRDVVVQTVGDVVQRLFAGSASNLVMSLVETRQLTRDELVRLRELLDEVEDE